MKILFFLALLANLVFFLWQYNAGSFRFVANETEFVASPKKQIWLLSELEKKPPVAVAKSNAAPVAASLSALAAIITTGAEKNNPQHLITIADAKPAQLPVPTATIPVTTAPVQISYCYQISGFSDKASINRWTQQQTIDTSSLQIKETLPIVADYVVNYPAAATPAEAKKNIEFLKSHGIRDFFMINHGEFKGAISLSVFKNEARATRAQQVLIQKGINAKVSKRYKTAATVSAQIKTAKTRPQLLATLAGHARQPSVKLLAKCE